MRPLLSSAILNASIVVVEFVAGSARNIDDRLRLKAFDQPPARLGAFFVPVVHGDDFGEDFPRLVIVIVSPLATRARIRDNCWFASAAVTVFTAASIW